MPDDLDAQSLETCRSHLLERLAADAERCFGSERATALHAALEQAVDDIVRVSGFPLGNDDRPGFFIHANEPQTGADRGSD